MDELEIGDNVLTAITADSGFATSFSPVRWFIHRRPEQLSEFITFKTATKSLKITPNHLLPVVECGSVDGFSLLNYLAASKPSQEAKQGDCLLTVVNGELQSEQILSVDSVMQAGIYSPITSIGNIVVNDVLASCYTGSNHQVRHAVFKAIEFLTDAVSFVAESLTSSNSLEVMQRADGEVPYVLRFLLSAQNAFVSA